MGPHKIFRCFPETDNYTVDIPFALSGFITVHTSLLAPWLENPDDKFHSRTHTLLGPVTTDAEALRYELERIIKHRTHKDNQQFFVKWLGYGYEHNSWQNKDDIDKEAIRAYWEKSKWSGRVQTRRAGHWNRPHV